MTVKVEPFNAIDAAMLRLADDARARGMAGLAQHYTASAIRARAEHIRAMYVVLASRGQRLPRA